MAVCVTSGRIDVLAAGRQFFGHRQGDFEAGALSYFGKYLDSPSEQFGKFFANRQAKAGSGHDVARSDSAELTEERSHVFAGDSNAGIHHNHVPACLSIW